MFLVETQEEEESTVIEQLPERTLQELSLIAKWLLNCGIDTDYMQVYSTIRSSIVVKSLHRYVTDISATDRSSLLSV